MNATETKTTHTPGPWTFEPSDGGDSSVGVAPTPPVVFTCIPNREDRHIDIAVVGSTVYDNSEDGYPQAWGDPDANARLIAAAPDMLAALKEAHAAINPSDRSGISLHEWNGRLKNATAVVCAAIAKAEGR